VSKIIVNVGVSISCMVLFGCSASPDQNKQKENATINSARSSEPPTGPLISKLQQTAVLDDRIQYAIDSFDKGKNLGQSPKGRTARDGCLFYIVRFRAKNTGQETSTVATDHFVVQTIDGQSYSPCDEGKTVALINGGSKELFGSELQPGQSKAYIAIFEIPVESMDSGGDLIIPSTKAGSSDRWVNRLDNHRLNWRS
jgi:Domain of unknown function (DUF4352)